jgi:3-hydroxyacyl-CoA dehydrogenase/3a,7a,12a-trihydroxy-5b-cholest-24-enoyl-CoA hydratase
VVNVPTPSSRWLTPREPPPHTKSCSDWEGATGHNDSVEEGHKVVDATLEVGVGPYRGGRERPELMLRVVAAGGHVDGLVNNAGIIRDSSFAKMTQQQWDDVYKVHLEGTMR